MEKFWEKQAKDQDKENTGMINISENQARAQANKIINVHLTTKGNKIDYEENI